MNKLLIKLAASVLVVISAYANAGLISGTHVTDGGKTVNLQGLEWLSFEHTANISRNTIESGLGWSDQFGNFWDQDEWRYATRNETAQLLNSLWDGIFNGYSSSNADGAAWFLANFGGIAYDTGYGNSRVSGTFSDNTWTNLDVAYFYFGADKECDVRTTWSCQGYVLFADALSSGAVAYDVTRGRNQRSYTASSGPIGYFSDDWGLDIGVTSDNRVVDNSSKGSALGSLLVRTIASQPPVTIPEPSTMAIFALGICGLASRRFKKRS